MDSVINKNNIHIDFYSEKDRKEYTDFLLNDEDANIYHTIECKEIIESHYKFKPYYLIARDENNKIRAILPFFYIKNFCGKRLDSIPHSIFGGAVGEEIYVYELLKKIFKIYQDLKCKYIIVRQHPNKYFKIFSKIRMKKIENRSTHIIQIKEPETLWNEILKSNRNSIRKAINNNLKVERMENREEIKEFHRMELITRKKFGISIPSINFFNASWDKLHPKGYLEIFITKYKEKPVASCIIYIFNKKVIFAHANSNDKYLQFRPNNLQLWKVIEWCYNNGYKFLNLGATPIENEGLFFFKSSFNTFNIPFAHYYYPADSTLLDNTAIGKIGVKILQKTPISISRRINPFLIRKFG